jgi:hypothetical protein
VGREDPLAMAGPRPAGSRSDTTPGLDLVIDADLVGLRALVMRVAPGQASGNPPNRIAPCSIQRHRGPDEAGPQELARDAPAATFE